MKQPPLWRSLRYAIAGIVWTLRTQRNARIHVVIATLVVAAGWWLSLDALRWSVLALVIGAVFVGEMINTAVEAIVDLLSPQWHDRAKVVKDVSAGAVLLLAIMAVVVGLLILGPPLVDRFVSEPKTPTRGHGWASPDAL